MDVFNIQLFGPLDYTVFGVLLLCSAMIGVYFGFCAKQKQDTTKEYLMGGKTMGIFPISMSLIASSVSGISLLGFPAEIYVYGSQFYVVVVAHLVASVAMMCVFLPVFYTLQITSSYEYLNLRFNRTVRMFGSVIFIIKMFLYIPIVIYVPALAFNQVTGINLHLVTPVVGVVCIFYTTLGGLKAVVWTDTLQTVLMYGGVVTVMFLGTHKAGGVSQVLHSNSESGRLEFFNLNPDPTLRSTFWTNLVGDTFNYLAGSAVNQAVVQRCLSMPSLRKSNTAILILMVGMFCMVSMSCYTGLVIYSLFKACDPVSTQMVGKADQILPFFVMGIAESVPGLPGLFVAGVFSAALSSMSTGLNSVTGVILEDIVRPCLKRPISEKRASDIMKLVAAVFGTTCVALVFLVERMGSLFQVVYSLSSITLGSLLGVFTLGMFFPWANSKGALSGGVSSLLLVSCMSIGQNAAIAAGHMTHLRKPVFTEGCPAHMFNQSVITGLQDLSEEATVVPVMYRVSYMYYTLLGTLATISVGLAVSFLTGPNDPAHINKDLLTPIIHRFLPKKPERTAEEKKLKADVTMEANQGSHVVPIPMQEIQDTNK